MNATPSNMAGALPPIERVREAKSKLAAAVHFCSAVDTKPVPLSEFENLCMGKGPQFAVHSISFVPEFTLADSDQIPVPDLDSLTVCPWDPACAWMFADLWWGWRRTTTVRTSCRTGA